jgi:adenine-specific DNA methylase
MKHVALIEEKLPLALVNAASSREKHLRHGHISTMHLWWARRPLAMARTVVLASLVPDPGDGSRAQLLADIANAAPFESVSHAAILEPLRKALNSAWPDRPAKVLDCFAGGGAIPLEASRLGCETTAVDINPVAHLIQKCVLEYPARYATAEEAGGKLFLEELRHWANWVHERADSQLSSVLTRQADGTRPAVYFWSRTIPCADPGCARIIPLISSRKLADSTRNRVRVDYDIREDRIELRVAAGAPTGGDDWKLGTKTSRGSQVTVTCPACGTARPDKELRRYAREHGFGSYLYAVLDIGPTGARVYREPTDADREAAARAVALVAELEDYADGTSAIPDEVITRSQYRRFPNLTYGIDTWAKMFTARQQLVLAVLAQTVRAAHEKMINDGLPPERARALATYLALAVDRVADYNSSFVAWVPSGEFVTHTFPQQSVRMTWDFCEIDPLGDGSGNWNGAINWIAQALRHCAVATAGNPAHVQRANAQHLPFADGEFDAVIIDPPYYDAFQYGDLSDFFYVWLKRSIGHLYPELFATALTPKKAEVIQNRADTKSDEYISRPEFEQRLQRALDEVARVVRDDGIVSLVFAHTDSTAWEHLLRGLRSAGLVVTTSWPMQSERTGRSTDNKGSVLASSVVLVCRKVTAAAEGFYDDVVRELDARIAERLAVFDEMKLSGADYFVSAIGPAFEVFARYSRVVRLSGEEVGVDQLMVLARQAVASHATRALTGGESFQALDDRSLLYLTWRWAYDSQDIPADEAYMLCRAFDLSLDALTVPGGLVKKIGSGGASYRLLGPDDRRRVSLGPRASLVDVMHSACLLYDQGRRQELDALLGTTGAGSEPAFWALVTAVAELLPEGARERTLLLGLGGNREDLAERAANYKPAFEELSLFDSTSGIV